MSNSRTEGNDRDFIQLAYNAIGFTGIAHLTEIKIKIEKPPQTLTFPKDSIAYIQFKQLPYQPDDYVQLKLGGSVSGEIVEPNAVKFTNAASGETLSWPRETIAALKFDIRASGSTWLPQREEILARVRHLRSAIEALSEWLERAD